MKRLWIHTKIFVFVASLFIIYSCSSKEDEVNIAFVEQGAFQEASGGNGDGVFNNGETVYFDVGLKNTGKKDTGGVFVAAVTSDNPLIIVEKKSCGTFKLAAGEITDSHGSKSTSHGYLSNGSNSCIKLTANSTIISETRANLTIVVKNEDGKSWQHTINVGVIAVIRYVGFVEQGTFQEGAGGNGDGKFNNGETVYFDIGLKNTSSQDIRGLFVASLTTDSGMAEAAKGICPTFDLAAGAVMDTHGTKKNVSSYLLHGSTSCIELTANPAVEEVGIVTVKIVVRDYDNREWVFYVPVEITPIVKSLEFVKRGDLYVTSNGVTHTGSTLHNGEIAYFDIGLQNTTSVSMPNIYVYSATSNNSQVPVTLNNCTTFSLTPNQIKDSKGKDRAVGGSSYLLNGTSSCIKVSPINSVKEAVTAEITIEVRADGLDFIYKVDVTVYPVFRELVLVDNIQNVWNENVRADRAINDGETVYFDVGIKNIGTQTATGVYVSGVSSNNPHLLAQLTTHCINPPTTIGLNGVTVDTHGTLSTSNSFLKNGTNACIKVVGNGVDGDDAYTASFIYVTIKDGEGNEWVFPVSVAVVALTTELSIVDIGAFYESPGNSDTHFNKGETIFFEIALKNVGTGSISGLYVSSISIDYVCTAIVNGICTEYDTVQPNQRVTVPVGVPIAASCPSFNIAPGEIKDSKGRLSSSGSSYISSNTNSCLRLTALTTVLDNKDDVTLNGVLTPNSPWRSPKFLSTLTVPVRIVLRDSLGNEYGATLNGAIKVEASAVRLGEYAYSAQNTSTGFGSLRNGETLLLNAGMKNLSTSKADDIIVSNIEVTSPSGVAATDILIDKGSCKVTIPPSIKMDMRGRAETNTNYLDPSAGCIRLTMPNANKDGNFRLKMTYMDAYTNTYDNVTGVFYTYKR